jgi:chromosome segregation ATPase
MADLKRRLFGYSSASVRLLLTERDAALDRASKSASAAEQRAERLSLELSETKGRLAGLEEQLDTAEKLCATLTADLEGAVAQRESTEAGVLPLRRELQEAHTELRAAKQAILGQEEQLRVAQAGSSSLEQQLRQQAERLEQATAEAAEGRASLQRALEESAGYQAAASAEQARLAELEALVEGYRELIEGRSGAEVLSVEPSDAKQRSSGPSTASELAAVIEVAEQAVASIMESTRVRAEEELRVVDGERERIRRDVETMTAWRDRAGPMIASLQAAMHEIQSQGAEIGRRVIEALSPVSTAVTALDSQLASLDDLARVPVEVSTEAEAAATPPGADDVMELPEEHPAGRDASDR